MTKGRYRSPSPFFTDSTARVKKKKTIKLPPSSLDPDRQLFHETSHPSGTRDLPEHPGPSLFDARRRFILLDKYWDDQAEWFLRRDLSAYGGVAIADPITASDRDYLVIPEPSESPVPVAQIYRLFFGITHPELKDLKRVTYHSIRTLIYRSSLSTLLTKDASLVLEVSSIPEFLRGMTTDVGKGTKKHPHHEFPITEEDKELCEETLRGMDEFFLRFPGGKRTQFYTWYDTNHPSTRFKHCKSLIERFMPHFERSSLDFARTGRPGLRRKLSSYVTERVVPDIVRSDTSASASPAPLNDDGDAGTGASDEQDDGHEDGDSLVPHGDTSADDSSSEPWSNLFTPLNAHDQRILDHLLDTQVFDKAAENIRLACRYFLSSSLSNAPPPVAQTATDRLRWMETVVDRFVRATSSPPPHLSGLFNDTWPSSVVPASLLRTYESVRMDMESDGVAADPAAISARMQSRGVNLPEVNTLRQSRVLVPYYSVHTSTWASIVIDNEIKEIMFWGPAEKDADLGEYVLSMMCQMIEDVSAVSEDDGLTADYEPRIFTISPPSESRRSASLAMISFLIAVHGDSADEFETGLHSLMKRKRDCLDHLARRLVMTVLGK